MIIVIIIGISMGIGFILNYMFRLSVLSSSGFANMHLPVCFRPKIFTLNIALNMLSLDSFVSCLDSLLGHPTGELQDLKLIGFAVFVPWITIKRLSPVCCSFLWK